MKRNLFAVHFLTAALLLTVGTSYSQQPPTAKKIKIVNKTQQIIQLLNTEIDMKLLRQAAALKLGDFFDLLKTRLPETKGKVTIIINRDQFRLEDPDAPDILETELSFREAPQRLPLASVLRSALATYPVGNATFLIRRGAMFITTEKSTLPQVILAQPVNACFVNQAIADALRELADQTGVAVVVDPRIGNKANSPVTAIFANNVSLETALVTLCEMAELKTIPLGRAMFVTTPERAKALRRLSRRLQNNLRDYSWREPSFGAPGLGLQIR